MAHPFGSFGSGFALILTGYSALAAGPEATDPFSEHRHAGDGRLHFLRNDAVQPTAAQVAARSQPARPATLSVFERAELNSPAWSNEVATARQFLTQHGARFVTGHPLTPALSRRERGQRSPRREKIVTSDHSSVSAIKPDSRGISHDDLSFPKTCRFTFPLPQGEGERCFSISRWSCLAFLAWLLLSGTALAQPITVLDRIGPNSTSTDGNPGGLIIHDAHGTSNELWGTAGTVWTQPCNGTLGEVAFVGFARVVNPTNGMYLDPVTNLSTFSLSLHLWTNGAAGFLAATNPAHGDVVLPLGPGPVAPPQWGVTAVTNRLVNTTNRYVSTLPTFRLATNLAAFNVRLQAGREYVLALAFEGADTNVVIRQSTARGSGAADVFAMYAGTRGLASGVTTNAFSQPQFATMIQVQPEAGVPALSIARRASAVDVWWPETAASPELWTTTNLADGPWALWPDPLTTNFLSLTNTTGQQFFRLLSPTP